MTTDLLTYTWKVFLDGIEIPFNQFSYDSEIGAPSRVSINVESDVLISTLPPQTVVHIFVKTHNKSIEDNTLDDFKANYKLYWEGIVTAITEVQQPNSVGTVLTCESLSVVLRYAQLFAAIGTGGAPDSIISGSSFTLSPGAQDILGSTDLIVSATYLSQLLQGSQYTLAQKIRGVLETVCADSAIVRQMVARYRLLDKFDSVSDSATDLLSSLTAIGQLLANQISTQLGENATVYDMLDLVLKTVFQELVPVTLPTTISDTRTGSPDITEITSLAYPKIPVGTGRADFIITPNTYFLLPPPCNIILPTTLSSYQITRDFSTEYTRTTISDPIVDTFGFSYVLLAPTNIFSRSGLTDNATLREYFEKAIPLTTRTDVTLYPIQQVNGTSYSALDLISDEEYSRGILVKRFFPDFLTFSNNSIGDNSLEGLSVYKQYLLDTANYRYSTQAKNRIVSATLAGNIYLAVGFSTIIYTNTSAYLGRIVSMSTTVDDEGGVTTAIQCDNARPIYSANYLEASGKIAELLRSTRETIVDIDKKLSAVFRSDKLAPASLGIKELSEIPKNVSEYLGKLEEDMLAITDAYDLPVPPPYTVTEGGSFKGITKLYNRLLGTNSFYEVYSGQTDIDLDSFNKGLSDLVKGTLKTDMMKNAIARVYCLYTFTLGLSQLNRLHPLSAETETFSDKVWMKESSRSRLTSSLMTWERKNVTGREGTSAQEFLKQNQLKIALNKDASGVVDYLVLTAPEVVNLGTLSWDNTIFSKIVDEGVMANKPPIPAVSLIRSRVKDPTTTSVYRQKNLTLYADRHFGSKAHKGI